MNAAQVKILALIVAALLVVWAVTALVPSGTNRPTADFHLPRIAADSVDTIRVKSGAETITLARSMDSTWTVNGLPAARTALEDLLTVLRDTAHPEPVARSGADTALLALEFDSTANGFWVRRRGETTVYRLGSWEANQLTPPDSTLRRKTS